MFHFIAIFMNGFIALSNGETSYDACTGAAGAYEREYNDDHTENSAEVSACFALLGDGTANGSGIEGGQ